MLAGMTTVAMLAAPTSAWAQPRSYDGPSAIPSQSPPQAAPRPALEPSPSLDSEGKAAGDGAPATAGHEGGDVYDPARHGPEAMAARRWLVGGVLLTTAGAVLGAGSVAMGVSDPCARPAGNSCQAAARNRATWTMAVPAMAMLAAGVAMISVGTFKRSRLRASLAAGRSAAHATLEMRF